MRAASLTALVEEHLEQARGADAGRSAHTTYGGQENRLRQTLIALAAGRRLAEHEPPGEGTLQVLRGTVRLHAGAETWDGAEGDLLVLPLDRHDLEAVTDAAVLLTVVTGTRAPS